MDVFKLSKDGVEITNPDERPAHDLFVQYDEYLEIKRKIDIVTRWCQTNIEDQTLVSGFARQVRDLFDS